MPRRRRTAKVANKLQQKRVSMIDMDEETRKEKVQVLIGDFEKEVESRLANYALLEQQAIRKIQAAYKMELCKIPPHLRDMKVSDFLAAGGSFDAAAVKNATEIVKNFVPPLASSLPVSASSLESIDEENQLASSTNTQRPKRKRKGQVSAAPSTARTLRSKQLMQTPANSSHPCWGNTPMVTPKFDPKLPRTPDGLREPRPGETFMSMDGSPLKVPDDIEGWQSLPLDQMSQLQKQISSFIRLKKKEKK